MIIVACLGVSGAVAGEVQSLPKQARGILENGVRELLKTESGRRYFAAVDPQTLMISDKVEARSDIEVGGGWIVLWRYQKGEIRQVINQVKGSPFSSIPGFADDEGIYCEVFIGYGRGLFNEGHRRFVTKGLRVNGAPGVGIGYYLIKKSPDEALDKALVKAVTEMRTRLEGREAR